MLSPYYQEALEKPWTFFIYNWSHDQFWTLCGNMIWLTVFGLILQNQGANKHLFPIYLYSGIDRIDSNLGYLENNVVPCCKFCNFMKLNLTTEDFLNRIAKIYLKNYGEN